MALRITAVWLVLCGFYLFLAGELSLSEAIAAIVSASFGAAFAFGQTRVARRAMRLRAPIAAYMRPLRSMAPDTIAVGRELVTAIFAPLAQRGGFVRQPFEPGTGAEAPTNGRRALVVLGLSLAPRTFVIRGAASDTLILHALPPKPASSDPRWPA